MNDSLNTRPEVKDDKPPRQKRFNRPKPVAEDENRQFIPLSMLLGGETEITPVEKDVHKHIVRPTAPAPRGWYKDKHTPKNVRPRPCYSEATLTLPYGGFCDVGCSFCYVNMGTRGYKSTLLPTVNDEYPEQMDKQLAKMWVTGAAYMSSYTEVFQKLEEKYHITERLTNVCVKWNVPIFYLSRKIPPDWVIPAIKSNPYSYMQWSINTSNPSDLRRLSPGSFKLDELYEAIGKFSKEGIYTSFQVNPILPGITTLDEILDLIRLIAEAGGRHVIIKFVEESSGNRNLLIKQMYEREMDGADILDSLLTDFFGHQYYIKQELRVEWLKEILKLTRELGITMATCYEYYKNGKSGASIAPWFNTADQCHGPAVPVHYKKALDQPFQALEGCFRKGCLYCEEFGTKACRNDTLISATALQYKDYRSINLNDGISRENDWNLPGSAPRPELAATRGMNPGFKTDAEIWGLPPLDDVIADPSIVRDMLPDY